ncbi:uncharacterized protein LOC127200997 [Acomys russatus]|uniref:uncharacterized protein LOC127200997 n=1 Tax=Acomys russatus TaxID=60746 RepID=UPI0021E2AA1C|nr:uncharacterized protein LOC127200997 [Acomys russatus]
MLLPLLGACAVVGPFQGPEWEPVRGLLPRDRSCRDPRCCGNLLVFCLFLIWQIQQYRYHVSRMGRRRNVTKVPPQRGAVSSTTLGTFFGTIPKFCTHEKIRGLDVHVHRWTQKQRWGNHRKSDRRQWATEYLLSPQNPCPDLSWVVHSSSEPIFGTSSFSSTCLLPQNDSWEAWQVPWYLRDSQAHPALNMCQRIEQLLAPSQEELLSADPVRQRYSSTSLPNFPLAQRSGVCLRKFLPDSLKLQWEMSLDSPQGPLVPWGKIQTVDREATLHHTNEKENRRERAWETRASGAGLPVVSGVEEDAEAEALACGSRGQVRRETEGELPGKKQDPMRTAGKEQTKKPWKKSWREPGDRSPSREQMTESQEQFRCKTDTATQTPEWGSQEDAVEAPAPGKRNEGEARGKGEAEVQHQALETLGWTGSNSSGNSQMLKQRVQDRIGGDPGTVAEAEEGRHGGQTGSEDGAKIQSSHGENLREAEEQDSGETQALEWEKQACLRTGSKGQAPVGEGRRQSGSANRKTQATNRGNQDLSRHEVQVGVRKLREVREEDWVMIQAPWWGNQRLLLITVDRGPETPQWGSQNQVRGEHTAEIRSLESDRRKGGDEDVANNLTPEAGDQGKIDLETYPEGSRNEEKIEKENGPDTLTTGKRNPWRVTGYKEAAKAVAEDGAEVLILGSRTRRGAGGGEGAEIKAAMEESQSWLGDTGPNPGSSALKNQRPVETEVGTEVQVPEKRKQRESGEDTAEIQRPESKNQGQWTEAGGSRSARWRSWGRAKGENVSGNGVPGKKNWREAGRVDGGKMQRPRRKTQRLLRKMDGKTYLREWKNQQRSGDGNAAEIQNQGKRNLRSCTGDAGSETQASAGEDQRQSVCETDEKIQTQGQRIESKGRDAATEIQDAGVQRKHRAEDAKLSHTSRRRDKDQVRRKDVVRLSLQGDSSGGVEPTGRKCSLPQPASLAPAYGTPGHKQPLAETGAASAPCPEEHLRRGTAAARKRRGGVSESSQSAQPGSQRRQERDKGVDPGKASGLTCQYPYPQSQACSVFPSLLCPQVSQAAPALASAPAALTTLHKWPALKKSKHLLLESLMKRRIAHLRWGLPRRILESYLLFHFLESCSLPRAGVRLPGIRTDQEHQTQQGRPCESLGPESPGRLQGRPVVERKSLKPSTQVQALEKCRPPKAESTGSSGPPKKPRRIRPLGGARDPQIQEEAPRTQSPASRNPSPAAESRSWCGPEPAQELSIEDNRDRKMVRPGVPRVEERASSRVRASSCPEGDNHRKKECVPMVVSTIPRVKCQQSIYRRSERVGSAEHRGAWQPPAPCSARTSSIKGDIHSAAARVSMTILNKMPWLQQLVKLQHSGPVLTLRNPTPFSKVGAPYTRRDGARAPTALEKDLEPPGHCDTGLTVPETESCRESEIPGKPTGAPRKPAVSQKFGFMRHLRYFLRQYGLKK